MTAEHTAPSPPTPASMPGTSIPAPAFPATASEDAWALLDALLYAVSHDLRSPLLTMSLSVDLIDEATADARDTMTVALDALRHGAGDLERMLQALTLLSRARRKALAPSSASLSMVLGGHVVISEEEDLGGRVVHVDPLTVREMLDAVAPEGPLELHVRVSEGFAVLACALPAVSDDASPLHALARSLQYFAGTPVQELAAGQVLLERQGARVRCAEGRLTLALPLESPVGR